MKKLRAVALAFLLVFVVQGVSAQNENRRWAFEGQIGPTFIPNKSGVRDVFGVDNGVNSYVGVEYFIPWTHFSTRVGYKKDELNLAGQLVQAEYSQVSLGGRWYPGKEEWFVQPHVGLGVNVKTSDDSTSHISGFINGLAFDYSSTIKSPAISFSPSVGFDFYVLTSLAFTMNYSYDVGLCSRYKIHDSLDPSAPLVAKGNLNHGTLNFGVKLTFPFHFTDIDGRNLFISMFESFLTSRRYK